MALLGALTHAIACASAARVLRAVVLLSIALAFLIFAIAWYRTPATGSSAYPMTSLALALGAWLANAER